MKKKNGFTLAEVLVTLGIIGVIATIMLPALNNAQPNKEMVMLKKAYYNVSRIVTELINDEDFYPERDEENLSGFSNVTISDQMGGDNNEARFHGYVFSGESKFCGLFAAKINTVQGGDPNDLCRDRVGLDAGGNFTTADGVVWSMPHGTFGRGGNEANGFEDIYVDVNGINPGLPNCTRDVDTPMTTCPNGVGPDRFVIRVRRHGQIQIPSRIGQLYATSTRVNTPYAEFVQNNPDIE